MTFKELYESEKAKPTAAQIFIKEIAGLTKKSETTVRMWLSGIQKPDALTLAILAKHFKTTEKELFKF